MNSTTDVIAGVGLADAGAKSRWPARLDWVQRQGVYKQEEVEAQDCTLTARGLRRKEPRYWPTSRGCSGSATSTTNSPCGLVM